MNLLRRDGRTRIQTTVLPLSKQVLEPFRYRVGIFSGKYRTVIGRTWKNIVNDNKSIAAVNVQVYETRRAYKCRCEAVYSRRSMPRSIPLGQHRTPAPDGYRYSRSRHCMVTSDSPAAGTQHQPMSCHRYIYSTNTYRHTISYISVTNLLLLLLLLLLLILGYRHQRADERHDNPPPR